MFFGGTFVIERLAMEIGWERRELFTSGNCRVKLLESFGACNRVSSVSVLLCKIAHLQWKGIVLIIDLEGQALDESMSVLCVAIDVLQPFATETGLTQMS